MMLESTNRGAPCFTITRSLISRNIRPDLVHAGNNDVVVVRARFQRLKRTAEIFETTLAANGSVLYIALRNSYLIAYASP
jgi:hypothetical protein